MKKMYLSMVIALLLVGCGGGGSTTPPAATTNEATTTTENVETTNTTSEITTTTANESQSFDAPTIDAETKQSYLDAINAVRALEQDCGSEGIKPAVSALEWNDSLHKAAYEHSEDLAESDTFSHDGSGTDTDWTSQVQNLGRGSTTKERIENNGYTNWRAIGENITAGTSWDIAEEAVQSWIESPPHCANLMSDNYTEVGMAMVKDTNSLYTHYWTQNFGKPQ